MAASRGIIFQLVLGVYLFTSQVAAVPVEEQVNLVRLGSSGNVTYYVGQQEITWEEGKYLCQFNNFTLAEVHNTEQEEFLKQALTDLNEFSHYHTAGRTRRGLDALKWDNSFSALNELSAVELDTRTELCLLIRVPDYQTLWETDPCTDKWPPICQSI